MTETKNKRTSTKKTEKPIEKKPNIIFRAISGTGHGISNTVGFMWKHKFTGLKHIAFYGGCFAVGIGAFILMNRR